MVLPSWRFVRAGQSKFGEGAGVLELDRLIALLADIRSFAEAERMFRRKFVGRAGSGAEIGAAALGSGNPAAWAIAPVKLKTPAAPSVSETRGAERREARPCMSTPSARGFKVRG